MNVRLMNSAMMPAPGRYDFRRIGQREFLSVLKTAALQKVLVSYCGYPQNAELLTRMSGVEIPVSRAHAGPDMENGDILLTMTLRYRTDGSPKGKTVSEDDFEFGIATFSC